MTLAIFVGPHDDARSLHLIRPHPNFFEWHIRIILDEIVESEEILLFDFSRDDLLKNLTKKVYRGRWRCNFLIYVVFGSTFINLQTI